MSGIKLLRFSKGQITELQGSAPDQKKLLQTLIEGLRGCCYLNV